VAGAYAELGPVLSEKVTIRPDFYVAGGEVTTELGFDVDGLFPLPWSVGAGDSWRTYAGIGASFALSHESFQAPVNDSTTTTTASNGTTTTTQDRFDFSDTDSNIHDTDSDFNDTIALSDTLFQCDGITLVLRDVGILAASSRYHEAGRQAPMRPSRPSLPCPNVRVGAAIMEIL